MPCTALRPSCQLVVFSLQQGLFARQVVATHDLCYAPFQWLVLTGARGVAWVCMHTAVLSQREVLWWHQQ